MRIGFTLLAVFSFALAAWAADGNRPTAILVSPIHEAQVVRGDDGTDHVEYELLVVSVFPEPVTLTSVTVIDPSGKKLVRIEGSALAAATQPLFAHEESVVIPASAAVAIEVDLGLPPNTAPERVTHKISYALKAASELAPLIGSLEVNAPEVAIGRRPPIVIKPPVRGDGWLVSSGCCKPNIHRDLRIAIDGVRIETPETFAIDWNRVKNDRIYDGEGNQLEQHYAFGQEVFAVADGTVVAVQDGKPEMAVDVVMKPNTNDDYGGNYVILEIAPKIYALYLHLHPGSLTVKVGDVVKAGAPLARIGNTGPSMGPHLHFSISDKPDLSGGRSLPFVIDDFTSIGAIDLDTSQGNRLVILPNLRHERSAYPLYGSIQNYR
jgi:hypothetical protein